jgi:cytochrome d ubiquinol oxidase subunit I
VSDLLAARSQMAISLAFHIVFAVVGIGMPVLMVLAEARWRRSGDRLYLELARRWAKGTAILFAVGAVSGTVLSFELGLLWPGFMAQAGAVIGLPFALEGFAFFTEAIFLGVYLYGWERIPPRAHLAAGVLVALSGALSGVFVVIANAWMNAPTGFELAGGRLVGVDPIAAMQSPAALPQTLHMTLAAYASTGFVVAGIHALLLLRSPGSGFHRRALVVALWVGAPAALLQPLSGDLCARHVAHWQPAKLAAMEGQFRSERGAPLRIGGWPDAEAEETPYALEIPKGLSLLAFHDPAARVEGLAAFPREDWPPVAPVHLAFQVMVGLGSFMALVAAWALALMLLRRDPSGHRWLLRALVVAAPMGFLCTEAGWVVTEVGRQPWVIHGVLRTADAVTPMPGLVVPFATFSVLYCFLGGVVAWLLYQLVVSAPTQSGDAR